MNMGDPLSLKTAGYLLPLKKCWSARIVLCAVSTVYNKAIATSNTEIIVNSVIVLFVMEFDEWNFSIMGAINEKWTNHEAESEDASSDAKAGGRGNKRNERGREGR
ncbi:hypothetical protein QTG54_015740 [Skeletonema marinoi]|uniref:Uncharacterized protein n=1 Tax=Skeletonema marinoi TaxID=267567 RepID=A0AAD8XU68_9STRA|nr:hypothetical protein QTG54_015740 [Skeletonema marinoi]